MKISGFVLAGGKSSRMGRDKAFIEFGGKPLIQLAVERLRSVCDDVGILGNDAALARFGEVIPDEVADCGPLSGIVQGLRHAKQKWTLFTPVDVPLLPVGLLQAWAEKVLREETQLTVCCLADAGQAQPLICMIHRSAGLSLEGALARGERKVLPALRAAGESQAGFRIIDRDDPWWSEVWTPSRSQEMLRDLWFGNVNTPEELAEVEQRTAGYELNT